MPSTNGVHETLAGTVTRADAYSFQLDTHAGWLRLSKWAVAVSVQLVVAFRPAPA
jgi:hypothetical protein